MKVEFTKMHGCGNDYIYINCMKYNIENPQDLSKKLSNRKYGIGGDGLILICKSNIADAKMRIFNTDGSEGKMCGNGIRCVGKYLYDKNIIQKKHINIETLSGIKNLELQDISDKVSFLKVNMGKPEFNPKSIPVKLEGDKVILREITIENKRHKITCVSMGNPHCIVFCNDVFSMDIKSIGIELEESGLFPEGVNIEFVTIINSKTIFLRVWERGSGETLACGTGACAGVVAAAECKFCDKNEDVTVMLSGGQLDINYKLDGTVYMTGPAEKVFEGEVEID